MIKVLGLGDNVCDKYLHEGIMYPGGNSLNVAVFSKMFGKVSSYMGVIGNDPVGQHVKSVIDELGIDYSHCVFADGDNGFARVILVDGDRTFLKGNSGGISRKSPLSLTFEDIEYISGFDLVHTSIFSYIEPELPKLQDIKAFISMDFSNIYTEEYLSNVCRYVDCAEVSCGDMDENEILKLIKRIEGYGCRKAVIATRGSKGAFVSVNGKIYDQKPNLVTPIDTMGAGDAFIAAFLVNYIESMKSEDNDELEETKVKRSLEKAAEFSSMQCLKRGSFGFGKEFVLSPEDSELVRKFMGGR